MIDWQKPVSGMTPPEMREHLPDHVLEGYEAFDVPGAGLLLVSKRAGSSCGPARNGFSIKCTWGSHGLAGGAMDGDDAKRLADHIYAALEARARELS